MLYHFFSRYISLTIGWLLAKNRQVLQVFFSFCQPLAKNEVSFSKSSTVAVTTQLDFCVKISDHLEPKARQSSKNWPSHLESSNGLFLQFLNESSKERKKTSWSFSRSQCQGQHRHSSDAWMEWKWSRAFIWKREDMERAVFARCLSLNDGYLLVGLPNKRLHQAYSFFYQNIYIIMSHK